MKWYQIIKIKTVLAVMRAASKSKVINLCLDQLDKEITLESRSIDSDPSIPPDNRAREELLTKFIATGCKAGIKAIEKTCQ